MLRVNVSTDYKRTGLLVTCSCLSLVILVCFARTKQEALLRLTSDNPQHMIARVYKGNTGRLSGLKIPLRWHNITLKNTVNCVTGEIVKPWPSELKRESYTLYKNLTPQEDDKNRRVSFSNIFKSRVWGGNSKKDVKQSGILIASGAGSAKANTLNMQDVLTNVIADIKVALRKDKIRLLDVPCGDFNWMSQFLQTVSGVDYTGMDIVPDIISFHQERYASSHNDWHFKQIDIAAASSFDEQYDLIHTRHMTQHLTNYDTLKILDLFSRSGSKFALMTTYTHVMLNTNLNVKMRGRTRWQNLEKAPYSLEPPLCLNYDISKAHIGLWRLPLYQV